MSGDEVSVRALRCGTLAAAGEAFAPGLDGEVVLQVWSFLVDHPAGTVLFDTGMHPQVRDDAPGRLGTLADLFTLGYGPDDDVASRLAAVDTAADDVDVVVASHLHFDHAGGNALVPDARVVVQRAEIDHARRGDDGAYLRADWDTGHDLQEVEGEHDLFGDGRVVCVPTHGHTPGHQSLLVRLDAGDLLLTADACYLRHSLEHLALPIFGWDLERQREVMRRFQRLEAGGTTLVFGHDPVLSPGAQRLLSPAVGG